MATVAARLPGGMGLGGAARRAQGQCQPQELAKLLASDAAASDHFGISVSVSGDTAVIRTHADDHAGGTDAGSAYEFDLNCSIPGDLDGDGNVDLDDFVLFADCLNGAEAGYPVGCGAADMESPADGDVDLADFAEFQAAFPGSGRCRSVVNHGGGAVCPNEPRPSALIPPPMLVTGEPGSAGASPSQRRSVTRPARTDSLDLWVRDGNLAPAGVQIPVPAARPARVEPA